MHSAFVWFWSFLVFASIGWYGFLVLYVGARAGREIRTLTRTLAKPRGPE